jgi:hypothetical protein
VDKCENNRNQSSVFCNNHENLKNTHDIFIEIMISFITKFDESDWDKKNRVILAFQMLDFIIYNKKFVKTVNNTFRVAVVKKIDELNSTLYCAGQFEKYKIMFDNDFDYKTYFTSDGKYVDKYIDNIAIEL